MAAPVLGATLVSLALMEAIVRIAVPQPIFRFRFSPTLLWEQEPGAVFVYRKADFRVPVTYNSAGLRDREHQLAKGPAFRIAAVGDSFTEDLQVPLEATYPAQLEAFLNARSEKGTHEVINFGATGYGPDQYLVRLRDQAMAYQPDLVLVGVFVNDLDDLAEVGLSRLENGHLVLRRVDPWSRAGLGSRFRFWAGGRSHLFTFVMSLWARARQLANPDPTDEPELLRRYHSNYQQHRRHQVDLADAIFAEMRRVARPPVRIVAVLFPAQEQIYEERFRALCRDPGCDGAGRNLELPQILLGGALARAGIPVIDLLKHLRIVARTGAELYFHRDIHLNALGNRVVAEFVAHELVTRGLVARGE